jgi:hypothetical protein
MPPRGMRTEARAGSGGTTLPYFLIPSVLYILCMTALCSHNCAINNFGTYFTTFNCVAKNNWKNKEIHLGKGKWENKREKLLVNCTT